MTTNELSALLTVTPPKEVGEAQAQRAREVAEEVLAEVGRRAVPGGPPAAGGGGAAPAAGGEAG